MKTSSEAIIERSDSSSMKTDTKPELGRDDESGSESKPREDFSVASLDYDSTERSSPSNYKVKERENILDDDDDVDNPRNVTKFYIGESSGNVITRTSNEMEQSQTIEETTDFLQSERDVSDVEIKSETEQEKKPLDEDDSQREVRFNLQPEEIGISAHGNDEQSLSFLEAEREAARVEEKCETESQEKNVLSESLIATESQPDSLEFDRSFESDNVQSDSFESHILEAQQQSHVDIVEVESNASDNSTAAQEEPVVCFPEESQSKNEHSDVKFEQLGSFDSISPTDPHGTAVIHSPIEDKQHIEQTEQHSMRVDTEVYAEEMSERIEFETTTDILEPVRVTQTEIVNPLEGDLLGEEQLAPVVHSPVESSKPAFSEEIHSAREEINFLIDTRPEPVQHSPVEAIHSFERQISEKFELKGEDFKHQAEEEKPTPKEYITHEDIFNQAKSAPIVHSSADSSQITELKTDDFIHHEEKVEKKIEIKESPTAQLDEDIFSQPKSAPVMHSPIESSKPVVVDEPKEAPEEKLFEDFLTESKRAPVLHSPIEPSKSDCSFEQQNAELAIDKNNEESGSSNGGSANKLDVVHRRNDSKVAPKNRWSATDPDNYSSPGSHNESLENSRPCSSDVENVYVSYPNSSAEYQTALDASFIPGSSEYQTAASTFDHSGKTISSHESMKSFDSSQSSGNLGSVEMSEASETLVPSTAEDELDFEDAEPRLSSLETFGETVQDEHLIFDQDDDMPLNMKRSHEMIFDSDINQLTSGERTDQSERKASDEEFKPQSEISSDDNKFGTSATDASILSMSLSSTSNVDTIVENIHDDMASSYGSSLIGSYETKTMMKGDGFTSTSFEEKYSDESLDNLVMTTTTVTEDDVTSVNTQITTNLQESPEATEQPAGRRGKGHKRNDSTSFLAGLEMAKLCQESTDSSELDEEMIIHDVVDDEKDKSGSDSDYDRYETEYSRSFKTPNDRKRTKKTMATKSAQLPEVELERKKSVPCIETIVEDVMAEDFVEPERSRATSQNMLDYSNIPDIMITDDPTKYVSDDDDDMDVKEPEPEIVAIEAAPSEPKHVQKIKFETSYVTPVKVSDEQYEQLIEQQYKVTEMQYDQGKSDSPTSDSFELIEQPDISDEFVIIEEVAKEADESMTEGKSVSINQMKYVKKHDDDVEKILVKSAPAATNEGSTLLQGHHDLAFEFEDSPSSGAGTESSGDDPNGLESSRKWVEMQLAEQAQNLRYPYDERGMLEDIKEEDTDFEVGSSRISSFKDSYSSNDFEAAAARRYHMKEHDNISMNSLQEFESLEQAISLENKRYRSSESGSHDSFSNGSFPKRGLRSAQADEISLASLKDFEGLENACLEATLLEMKAKEEHAILLSRSDESNKSDENSGAKRTQTTKTIVTRAEPIQTADGQFVTQKTTVTQTMTEIRSGEDVSQPSLMEVSTDSLEGVAKQTKQQFIIGKTSQHGSTDSLEVSKSGDLMTSSIDSIEISKEGATAKSSKSDNDSIDGVRGEKRDSIDSIDAQYAAMSQSIHFKRDSFDANTFLDLTSSGTTCVSQVIETKTLTTVSGASSSGYGGGISKDISSDSLNIHQEPELLITSTESLDHTSSTYATYQNETDSQMTMSGSMTSCDSNTLVDSIEIVRTEYQQSADLLSGIDLDDKFGTRMTSTTVTTKTTSTSSDVDRS